MKKCHTHGEYSDEHEMCTDCKSPLDLKIVSVPVELTSETVIIQQRKIKVHINDKRTP